MSLAKSLFLGTFITANVFFGSDVSAQNNLPGDTPDSIVMVRNRELDKIQRKLRHAKPDRHPMAEMVRPGKMPKDTLYWGEVGQDAKDIYVSDILRRADETEKTHFSFKDDGEQYTIKMQNLRRLQTHKARLVEAILPGQADKETDIRFVATHDFIIASDVRDTVPLLELSSQALSNVSQAKLETWTGHEAGHGLHEDMILTIMALATDSTLNAAERKALEQHLTDTEFTADSAAYANSSKKTFIKSTLGLVGYFNHALQKTTDPEEKASLNIYMQQNSEFGYKHGRGTTHPSYALRLLYIEKLDAWRKNSHDLAPPLHPQPFHYEPKPKKIF